jgi:predicted choloylglycine hydrolase
MNEAGLAVGMMAIPYARSSQNPEKVTISSLQAIRLMLDYAKDVDEAISLLQDYNIEFGGGPPLHYLIADAARNSAIIEFVAGEMIVLRPDEPWQVSTNFVISQEQPEGADSSCWRYNQAYETLAEAKGKISSTDAMTLLENVSQDSTMWSVVYGMTTGDIQIAAGRKYGEVKEFELEMKSD